MAPRPSPVQPTGRDPARRAWWIFALCFLIGAAGLAFFIRQGIRDASVSDKTLQSLTAWKVVVKRAKKGFLGLDREYVFRVI